MHRQRGENCVFTVTVYINVTRSILWVYTKFSCRLVSVVFHEVRRNEVKNVLMENGECWAKRRLNHPA